MAERAIKSKVALTKGGDRAGNIETALRLIESEVDIRAKSNVLIKVNFVSTTNQLAATHVDAVRALLRFLRERYRGKITIGESTIVPAREGYIRFGYLDLIEEFDVQLVDLNEGQWISLGVYDSALRPINVRFSKQAAESDYRIAIGPPKTHDVVVVTLSIKNVAMGSLFLRVKVGSGGAFRDLLRKGYRLLPSSLRRSTRVSRMRNTAAVYAGGDKRKIHQGYPVHNLNLYLLAREYPPHLSIIDGYVGMDGDGPEAGDSVDWGIAIASQDPVAADCLAATLMGFDIADIGYLWYCCKTGLGAGEMDQMEILGADPKECYRQFRPSPTYEAQKAWRDDRIDELLGL
ncbi:MAG: DUF362 domain-containing protein [Dehalococcoidia bacterium]